MANLNRTTENEGGEKLSPQDEYLAFINEIKSIASLSLQFCLLWFCSNFFYNYGLSYTSVSSSTVLCNTSSIFVLIFSLCLIKGTKFSAFKALMVGCSFAGITIIALTDKGSSASEQAQTTLTGNLLTLLSATFYGLYAVILKKKVPIEDEDNFNFSAFLGMVGMFNAVILLPLFFILDKTGIEPFEWPSKHALGILSINAVLGTVISDFCWAKSVVLLGPLMTTLGIALTIPLSMIADTLKGDKHITWPFFIGTALIVGSFLGNSY